MDEVREGCDTQPSSPGHAEQRVEIEETTLKENGLSISQNEKDDNVQESTKTNNNDDDDGLKSVSPVNTEEGDKVKTSENCTNDSVNEQEIDNNNHLDDIDTSNDSIAPEVNTKRKLAKTSDDNPTKKLKSEIEITYNMRDKIFQQYIESMGCNNLEQIQIQTEQIIAEVRTLNELAKEKEREWNNIIHLRKMKEELLLRIQRQKQVLMINEKSDLCELDIIAESPIDFHEERQSVLKSKINNKSALKGQYSKRSYFKANYQNANHQELNGQSQNKQRNVVDVQSIIADYRQRHPETVPRRGRRIRSVLNTNSSNENGNKMSGVLNFSNLALGSGAQVRQNISGVDGNNDLLINPMDAVRIAPILRIITINFLFAVPQGL